MIARCRWVSKTPGALRAAPGNVLDLGGRDGETIMVESKQEVSAAGTSPDSRCMQGWLVPWAVACIRTEQADCYSP